MSVIINQLDFLSEVLQDFCNLHDLEYMSADDLLYDSDNKLSQYEKDWLNNYILLWDVIIQSEEVVYAK